MRRLFVSGFRFLVSNGRVLVPPSVVLVSGIVFQNLVYFWPWPVERFYSRATYPRVVSVLSLFSRGVVFSVGEVLTWLVLLGGGACAVLFCMGLLKRKAGRLRWVFEWLRYGVWVAAAALWFFLFVFGLNYQRPLLFELLGYEQRKAQPQELEALGRSLVESINQTYVAA